MRTFVIKGILFFAMLGASSAMAERLEVIEAWYGAGDRVCNASWAVADRCHGRDCEIYASNDLCGDPRRGREKNLYVTYACGRDTRSLSIPEEGIGVLSCGSGYADRGRRHESGSRARLPRRHRANFQLDILGAYYGTSRRSCDATAAAYEYCAGRAECAIPSDNYLCGDPHHGRRKSLAVEYTCGGRSRRATAREGRDVFLSCR